ncbi:aa3-type cytochrome c oxidase subunit IV [Xinfangfangia sp. D13-10-4-6]|nr:aa3-type cytochrome c oxidase subunit IV [Pseudogemmobacter hezensis]NPD17253.1 aa3-type cytochrome c oxidase subunit IV [Pseudogemmobacter hezensis]
MAEHNHGDYQAGSMDIRAQEKTFAGFIGLVKWSLVAIIVALVFVGLSGA